MSRLTSRKKHLSNLSVALIGFAAVAQLGACVSEGNDPGIEYAPNMYVSEAYEAFTQTGDMKYNPGGMTMRLPVPGTIARGQMDYARYTEGYEASVAWTNPVSPTEANLAEGEFLYQRYCSHCHGKDGKNDGAVIKNSEYPPPPWSGYQSEYVQTLPEGKIFHTVTFGKGLMGSHASVLTPEQRWKVIHFVKYLSNPDAFQIAPEALGTEGGNMGAENTGTADLGLQSKGLEGFEMASIDATVYAGLLTNMRNVQFEKVRMNKIKSESHSNLDAVAAYLLANPCNVVLAGHTARDLGMDAIQGEIALKRAQAVKEYLVSKGVPEASIKTKSYGSEHPLASNETEEGRELNRRVEIYFVK
ncbi:MAG: OmpA family protein [Flavobacteriales bacterium]|nr:OmpA family protein [Flavobacteriales bacterium]